MAQMFMEIFGTKLEKEENLLKVNNVDRLPSPHQLQGKIILKGTDRSSIKSPKPFPVRRMHNSVNHARFSKNCVVKFLHFYLIVSQWIVSTAAYSI